MKKEHTLYYVRHLLLGADEAHGYKVPCGVRRSFLYTPSMLDDSRSHHHSICVGRSAQTRPIITSLQLPIKGPYRGLPLCPEALPLRRHPRTDRLLVRIDVCFSNHEEFILAGGNTSSLSYVNYLDCAHSEAERCVPRVPKG